MPERLTVCGLFAALSLKVRAPLADPVTVGENVRLRVQEAFGARFAPQVLPAIANGAAAATDKIDRETF